MSDLISRQAAIDTVFSMCCRWNTEDANDLKNMLLQAFQELPTADAPDRKVGKWIKLYAGNYKCSVCGDWWGNDNNEMVEDFKYCPNCGARMEGEEG